MFANPVLDFWGWERGERGRKPEEVMGSQSPLPLKLQGVLRTLGSLLAAPLLLLYL